MNGYGIKVAVLYLKNHSRSLFLQRKKIQLCQLEYGSQTFSLFTAISQFSSESINVRSQIRAYWWEKLLKLINVPRTFIWNPRVCTLNYHNEHSHWYDL